MKESRKYLSLSELSVYSGFPETTINLYIRKGLLPKPIKTGKTRMFDSSLYTNRLKLIKKFKGENLSLNNVKEILNLIETERTKNLNNNRVSENIRDKIIEDAINLFLEKGYEKTTIADLVNSSNIGRSTFYKHFKNKKALFAECIKNIFIDIIREGDKQVPDKTNILLILEKRTLTYFKAYREWGGMMNLLRAAVVSDPIEFSDTLKEGLLLFINETNKLLQMGIQKGLFREFNSTLLSVMLMGALELCCYYYSQVEKDVDFGEMIDQGMKLFLHGINKEG
ncbi:MAG: TetR family transcriptional regulator [Desulfobacteraceae bacterium]|nr:TetR family transcriptional regulator [Desulfobacteraceae bacterium]MBC2756232.1 TetR family transcriptional regulator [Desulfobacteraceae bacterium]